MYENLVTKEEEKDCVHCARFQKGSKDLKNMWYMKKQGKYVFKSVRRNVFKMEGYFRLQQK